MKGVTDMTWEELSKFTWEEASSLNWHQVSLDKSKLLEQLSNGKIILSDSATKKLVGLCSEVVKQYNSTATEQITFTPSKGKLSLKDKIDIIQMIFNIFDKASQNEVLKEALKYLLNQFFEFIKDLHT